MQKTIVDFNAAKKAIEEKRGEEITNKQLYKDVGVSYMTAYNLQNGTYKNQSMGIALKLSKVSGLPLEDIIKPLKK